MNNDDFEMTDERRVNALIKWLEQYIYSFLENNPEQKETPPELLPIVLSNNPPLSSDHIFLVIASSLNETTLDLFIKISKQKDERLQLVMDQIIQIWFKIQPEEEEKEEEEENNKGKIISSKTRLKGEALRNKMNELGNTDKSDLAIACGYVDVYEDGKEVINFEEFYEALLDM